MTAIIKQLEETKALLSNRDALNGELEGIKNRIRELRKELDDKKIEEKVSVLKI